jgi:hypothetical protein
MSMDERLAAMERKFQEKQIDQQISHTKLPQVVHSNEPTSPDEPEADLKSEPGFENIQEEMAQDNALIQGLLVGTK